MAQKITTLDESADQLGVLAALPVTAESTTSRVLLNNPLIRVVYFAFDTGELLTDHSSPRAVVVQVLSGAIRFTHAGHEVAMTTGDLVYLAPGERHSLVADEPSHLSLVMVDVEALPAG
ncbi:MAG TPA: cupin domain-containing protein [Propionibacteriaceae bacterium]|nr:cupin domain-containing protein [Propionibacteriaceae bacterium]